MKKPNKQINKSTNPNPNPTKKEMGHSKSVEAHTEAPNLAQKRLLLIYLVLSVSNKNVLRWWHPDFGTLPWLYSSSLMYTL